MSMGRSPGQVNPQVWARADVTLSHLRTISGEVDNSTRNPIHIVHSGGQSQLSHQLNVCPCGVQIRSVLSDSRRPSSSGFSRFWYKRPSCLLNSLVTTHSVLLQVPPFFHRYETSVTNMCVANLYNLLKERPMLKAFLRFASYRHDSRYSSRCCPPHGSRFGAWNVVWWLRLCSYRKSCEEVYRGQSRCFDFRKLRAPCSLVWAKVFGMGRMTDRICIRTRLLRS